MVKNICALLLACSLLAVVLFSCSGKSGAASGSNIIVSLYSTPETIDPALNSASDGGNYLIHMFEGLIRYKWDGSGIEYGQAESHEVSEDGLVFTFTLRDGIKWSDGKEVTAQDFLYSWRRLVDPATAAPYAYDMGQYIKNATAITDGLLPPEELGVRIIGERVIEITLEEPCPYFLEIMAFPTFYPVRRDTIEEHGHRWVRRGDTYITNGPFKMESFKLDDRMVSVKNEYYWDIESVVPEKITWLFLRSDVARLGALRSGEVFYIASFPMEERNALEAAGMYKKESILGTYYLTYNHLKEPFNNTLVRKALTLAIDNAFIADVLRQGSVVPATAFVGEGFYTSGHDTPFREEGRQYIDPYNYERSKIEAQIALAQAGYPNGAGFPRIEYLHNEDSGHALIAEAIQQMWKDVLNINTEIRSAEWSVVLVDRHDGNFQVTRSGWIADFNDPVTMLSLFTSFSMNGESGYANPDYDALMAQSMSETDPAERSRLLHRAEDIMMGQDWACAPIYYYSSESAANPRLKDFVTSMVGYTFFHKAYFSDL